MGDILSDSIRTARKACPCDQCHRQIKIGERYRRQVHTFDGLCTYRAHEDCDAASQELHKLADLYPDEGYCLAEYADEDKAFLVEKYPAVAARFWPEVAV
ncbi:hypothetical protein HU230_0011535 [Bradyrhizobium quebecense]|uniref:Uncharacterized protein n=1 Tax=Bradyrhizobium quebecense TaxID=2748629 RepID=A0A974AB06_9BRAD|nr:hypothetical protein [Bradyrhizobium quebecense]UGA46627.1 hypothetical protein HU230_0011535 [Bradyrhizobium quebecense]